MRIIDKEFWLNRPKEEIVEALEETIRCENVLITRIDKALEFIGDEYNYSVIVRTIHDILKGSDSNEC